MPTQKLFVRQYRDKGGNNYLFYRYWDNHNNNYEYQVFQLVQAKNVARELGSPELSNTRQMSDWVWNNVTPDEGEYVEKKDAE
jgi:hypothetical protein